VSVESIEEERRENISPDLTDEEGGITDGAKALRGAVEGSVNDRDERRGGVSDRKRAGINRITASDLRRPQRAWDRQVD
jgi:hypothetical protein